MKQFIISALFLFFLQFISAQEVLLHSHNDYRQRVPFYQAYAQAFASIEADIFATDQEGELLVAHDAHELPEAPTLDESYIEPFVKLYRRNKGKAWKDSDKIPVLLIDLKTPVDPTLDRLIHKLQQHPEVFDPTINPLAVRVVISGNQPDPDRFGDYPTIISFDGNRTDYTPKQLERISMISLNLREYTRWNGKGIMLDKESEKVKEVIAKVHALNKPIRFWGTPDGVTAWNTFYTLGVDYINTDIPEACAAFFRDFHKKTYRIDADTALIDDVARATRLDKITVGFQGFHTKSLRLTKSIDVYEPTYRNDGKEATVRNVIFLIGDGMGLAQICAADAVNRGLTMLKLKFIGLQQNQAEDSWTTDSAAAGSALATGKKHKNRHISINGEGAVYPSLTDIFHAEGYATGVVSSGNLADATPAAFYGHSTERDNSNEITAYLLDGKLSLLNGSGMHELTERKDQINLIDDLQKKAGYRIANHIDEINQSKGKVICVDERMGKAATEETIGLLSDATREAIRKLSEDNKGFFLMVEGAKIDYAGHANSLPGSILETLSFDLAVAEALMFADQNGETLVIVTSDHETGGMTIVDGQAHEGAITVHYMTDDHTSIMLPVFTYGPQANKFTGVYPNTRIFDTILKSVNIK
ncbi:alkaline phosphatase [Bacteroides sp. OttesenSCG-928-D19]|nr:alkaline phosphatase [Bacteroides sp. OttesenSCG-928-D19]